MRDALTDGERETLQQRRPGAELDRVKRKLEFAVGEQLEQNARPKLRVSRREVPVEEQLLALAQIHGDDGDHGVPVRRVAPVARVEEERDVPVATVPTPRELPKRRDLPRSVQAAPVAAKIPGARGHASESHPPAGVPPTRACPSGASLGGVAASPVRRNGAGPPLAAETLRLIEEIRGALQDRRRTRKALAHLCGVPDRRITKALEHMGSEVMRTDVKARDWPNAGHRPSFVYRLAQERGDTFAEPLGGAWTAAPAPAKAPPPLVADEVIAVLAEHGPLPRTQIEEKLDFAKSSVARSLAMLGDEGKLVVLGAVSSGQGGAPAKVWGLPGQRDAQVRAALEKRDAALRANGNIAESPSDGSCGAQQNSQEPPQAEPKSASLDVRGLDMRELWVSLSLEQRRELAVLGAGEIVSRLFV